MIKYQGISTLEVLQDAKNYNNWIAEEMKKYITSPLLEVGAGTGNLTTHFLQTKKVYITDNDKGLVKQLKHTFITAKNVSVSLYDLTKNPSPSFTHFFSSIVSINVFEHIEDDRKALRNVYTMLKPKGKLILLVPAKQKAYTKLDRDLGHFRRYERKELLEKLESAGFSVKYIYFFNIVGLFSWYIRDKVSRKNIAMKPYQIALFDKIVPTLRFLEGKITIPVGISLIAVAVKKQ